MNNLSKYNKRKLLEFLTVLFVYFILSGFYYTTLWLNAIDYKTERDEFFDLFNWFDDGGLQYLLMLFSTFVIWFFIFRLFKNKQLWLRLLFHIIGLPFFVFIAQQGYYFISELLSLGHLQGNGQIWDIYIPTLIYLIQFGLFHAYEYYVLNQRKQQQEIELKNAALKSELTALKAQLNPHFLYNVFNTINASVPKEMETTRVMIAGLSDLFRYQLRASKEDFVPIKDELEFVEKYLELEKSRFEKRLTYRINLDDNIKDELMPSMILQPLVENSIKHGISSLIEGGHVEITVAVRENKIYFEVMDTGLGISKEQDIFKMGVGLGNTQKRLQKMYNSQIKIEDNQPIGTIISFEL